MVTVGLCECGCGQPTRNARQTDTKAGTVKGQPRRFALGHAGRAKWTKAVVRHYRQAPGQHNKTLHVVRAERALGKPLPTGAEVHHADGTKSDTAPLVICQDRAYHMFLHKLMRIRAAGGNPHTERICGTCKGVFPFASFFGDPLRKLSNYGDRCMECHRASRRRTA